MDARENSPQSQISGLRVQSRDQVWGIHVHYPEITRICPNKTDLLHAGPGMQILCGSCLDQNKNYLQNNKMNL